jgi:hypothetical protein
MLNLSCNFVSTYAVEAQHAAPLRGLQEIIYNPLNCQLSGDFINVPGDYSNYTGNNAI